MTHDLDQTFQVLEVKAWGNVKIMSVPLDTVTAFRFWPGREGALVLLLMSEGQQKALPLPLSLEIQEALQVCASAVYSCVSN